MTDFALPVLSVALLSFGIAIFWRQAKATVCPRHSRYAGGVAIVLGWSSVIVGIGLAIYIVVLHVAV